MALPATTVWECRTDGSATNGGGFNSARGGTDYSQQAAAQVDENSTVDSPGTTTLTCDRRVFTSAMVGNLMYLTGGGATTGWYEVVTYVDVNTVTLDRTPGAMTSGNGKLGGAVDSPQTIQAVVVAGNTVWVKAGTYTLTSALTPGNDGSRTLPIHWNDYTTVRGDATAPVATLDINGVDDHVYYSAKKWHLWHGFTFTGNPTQWKYGIRTEFDGQANMFFRSRVTNVGVYGMLLGGYGCSAIGCEIDNWGNKTSCDGIVLYQYYTSAIGCNIHSPASGRYGIAITYSGSASIDNIVSGCSVGVDIYAAGDTATVPIVRNILYGNTIGLNMRRTTTINTALVFNTLFVNNSSNGIASDATGLGHCFLTGCAFQGNGAKWDGNVTVTELVDSLDLTDDPFVKASVGDFRLNRTARALLGAGWPDYYLRDGELTNWRAFNDLTPVGSGRGMGDVGEYGTHWNDLRKAWDGG